MTRMLPLLRCIYVKTRLGVQSSRVNSGNGSLEHFPNQPLFGYQGNLKPEKGAESPA